MSQTAVLNINTCHFNGIGYGASSVGKPRHPGKVWRNGHTPTVARVVWLDQMLLLLLETAPYLRTFNGPTIHDAGVLSLQTALYLEIFDEYTMNGVYRETRKPARSLRMMGRTTTIPRSLE